MQLDCLNQSEISPPANTGSVTGLPAKVGVQQNLTDFSLNISNVTHEELKKDFDRYVRLPHRIVMYFGLTFVGMFGCTVLDFFWHVYLMVVGQNAAEYGILIRFYIFLFFHSFLALSYLHIV